MSKSGQQFAHRRKQWVCQPIVYLLCVWRAGHEARATFRGDSVLLELWPAPPTYPLGEESASDLALTTPWLRGGKPD